MAFGLQNHAVHDTRFKSRALCAQEAEKEKHRFFVGSSSLRESNNEIHLIEYSEETTEAVIVVQTYHHPKDIWSISPSLQDPALLLTGSSDGDVMLWRAAGASGDGPELSAPNSSPAATAALHLCASLKPGKNDTGPSRVLWSRDSRVAVLANQLRVWDIRGGTVTETLTISPLKQQATSGSWDPHHPSVMGVTYGCCAAGWDTRTSKRTYAFTCHKYAARDIDYNPNKPWTIVTAGDDRLVKFWDLRNLSCPLRTLGGHSHWCYTVKYNPSHDQLLLTGGTDSNVNLWRCSSISSAPLLELEGETSHKDIDCKVRSYHEHEESVYSIAWSSCDAWTWASLDFSGRVAVNHVPSTEKYKILL
jgi:WD40 repeat protein